MAQCCTDCHRHHLQLGHGGHAPVFELGVVMFGIRRRAFLYELHMAFWAVTGSRALDFNMYRVGVNDTGKSMWNLIVGVLPVILNSLLAYMLCGL